MIDDAEQIRDENRDASPKDAGDLIGRGIRADPTLPPIAPPAGGDGQGVPREHADARVPEHDSVLPRPDPEAPRLDADEVARLAGRDDEQLEAARDLDTAHGSQDLTES